MRRRPMLLWAGLGGALATAGARAAATAITATTAQATAAALPAVQPSGPDDDSDRIQRGRVLRFPRDHGAHPGAQTEWWYLTGHLRPASAPADAPPTHGFQVTFFRSRTGLAADLPGRLAPRQLLFAHAAVTRLGAAPAHRHDQRIARWNGEALDTSAHAARDDTAVAIGRWTLQRDAGSGAYRTAVASPSAGFALDLQLVPRQPLLLQGEAGFSRKGPEEHAASHYLSQPQLQVSGRLAESGEGAVGATPRAGLAVHGVAWLDHEWSDTLLPADAQGWDWIGMNLFDGSALTAFVLRRAGGAVMPTRSPPAAPATPSGAGAAALWAGGSWRRAGQAPLAFGPAEVAFTPQRHWTSPQTGARYPVDWRVDTPAGRFQVRALLDTQEMDSRASVGAVYWEGLSELLDESGRRVGLGYLEMTGYTRALTLGPPAASPPAAR